jgi:hypothetical protein
MLRCDLICLDVIFFGFLIKYAVKYSLFKVSFNFDKNYSKI